MIHLHIQLLLAKKDKNDIPSNLYNKITGQINSDYMKILAADHDHPLWNIVLDKFKFNFKYYHPIWSEYMEEIYKNEEFKVEVSKK